MEKTFAMIKPDAVQRGTGWCHYQPVNEAKGLRIAAMKIMPGNRRYCKNSTMQNMSEKPFFPGLLAYITSGPVIALWYWKVKMQSAEVRKI